MEKRKQSQNAKLPMLELIINIGVFAIISMFLLEMFLAANSLQQKAKDQGIAITKAETIAEHHMHAELCMLSQETADILNETRANGGRIICVGTTSCRTLESLVNDDGSFEPKSKWTEIFIYPGYTFKAMQGLITNFHLPESTLVMLVSAFAGRENVLSAYNEAVRERYRFFSFGDAMCIL